MPIGEDSGQVEAVEALDIEASAAKVAPGMLVQAGPDFLA